MIGNRIEIRLILLIATLFTLNSVRILSPLSQGSIVHRQTLEEGTPLTSIHDNSAKHRQCSSKEHSVPFPYGQCRQSTTASFAPDSQLSCGLCGQNAFVNALEELSVKLQDLVGESCSEMVTFGAALGHKYENMLKVRTNCTFMFLLENPASTTNSSSAVQSYRIEERGPGYTIRFADTILPYTNMRRNTKLFKMFGGLKLFSFAKRVIWQDAKLERFLKDRNYSPFFHESIDNTGACVSFRSMPKHQYAIGKHAMTLDNGVLFKDHCQVVLTAKRRNPPITDSTESIEQQCQAYEAHAESTPDWLSLDSGMVDSALVLWDMRSERCQQFNLELACTWLDETQCYGDRDQISFPQALRSVKISEKVPVAPRDAMARDKLFHGVDEMPAVHISRGVCHWYSPSAMNPIQCKNNVHRHYGIPSKRIAVVVAGDLNRYNFNTTLQHLIKPLTNQGHKVEYYLSLTSAAPKAGKKTANYMDHLSLDPSLPQHANSTILHTFIGQKVKASGGNARRIYFDRPSDVDKDPLLMARRDAAAERYPQEDPDTRFPVFDSRSSFIQTSTAHGNRDLLSFFYKIRSLWNELLEVERTNSFEYDYVMFLRENVMWLADLNFNELVSTSKTSAELFSVSCDARQPKMHPLEMNDDIVIATRNRAELFGNYFDHLFKNSTEECAGQLNAGFTRRGRRGCNSRMIYRWILQQEKVEINMVPQAMIPMQRAVYVEKAPGHVVPCFHQFCQSFDMPIGDFGIGKCASVF